MKRTCDQLGLCQGLDAPCDKHCKRPQHYFAPGVIEGAPRKRRGHAQLRMLVRWTLICVGLMSAAALLAFAVGYHA